MASQYDHIYPLRQLLDDIVNPISRETDQLIHCIPIDARCAVSIHFADQVKMFIPKFSHSARISVIQNLPLMCAWNLCTIVRVDEKLIREKQIELDNNVTWDFDLTPAIATTLEIVFCVLDAIWRRKDVGNLIHNDPIPNRIITYEELFPTINTAHLVSLTRCWATNEICAEFILSHDPTHITPVNNLIT